MARINESNLVQAQCAWCGRVFRFNGEAHARKDFCDEADCRTERQHQRDTGIPSCPEESQFFHLTPPPPVLPYVQ